MSLFTLVVEKGRLPLQEYGFSARAITIGSAPMNDVCIPDPSIGRVHVELRAEDGTVTVTPVGPDGTYLNGRPIRGRVPLNDGDRLGIGSAYGFRLRLDAGRGGPVTGTTDRNRRLAIPPWLLGYLVAMVVLFGFIAVSHARKSATFASVRDAELTYSEQHQLDAHATEQILNLLTLAQIEERRGNGSAAYELYRDALTVRTPPDPRSPAGAFAIQRMVAVRQ